MRQLVTCPVCLEDQHVYRGALVNHDSGMVRCTGSHTQVKDGMAKKELKFLSNHPHLFQHPKKPNLFCAASHEHMGACVFVTPESLPREALVFLVNNFTGRKQTSVVIHGTV